MKYKQLRDLNAAIKQINDFGSRFDNSTYWKGYYSEKAGKRDTVRERDYAHFLKRLSFKGTEVLDLASGYGFLPLELHRTGFKVTCVDKYPKMIGLAQKYLAKYGVKLKMVKGDVTALPFENGSFDLITAMSILEHIPISEAKEKFLAEISRVVRDEGIVFIHVPVKTILTIFKKWVRKNIVKDLPQWAIDDDGDVTHTMWLTIKEYSNMIEDSGFKIDYIRFNFMRSNEIMTWMKMFGSLGKMMDGRFFEWNQKYSLKYSVFSKIAVSVAFVCHKVI